MRGEPARLIRSPARLGRAAAAAAVAAGLAVPVPAFAHDADVPIAVTPFRLDVVDGPNDDQQVVIDGSLYRPATATPDDPAPVVVLAHGFGGSKASMDPLARQAAHHGYVAVTYSARGFGQSTDEVSLDSVQYDVKDVEQLIDHIATLPGVQLDAPGDPRIGFTGGSYGGGISFQIAAHDDRVDAIAPLITWSSLNSAITPNHLAPGFSLDPYTVPLGVPKLEWALFFSGVGMLQPVLDPNEGGPSLPPSECIGLESGICEALLEVLVAGQTTESAARLLRDSSPYPFADKIDIPTLIIQGQEDTLFNLTESIRIYEALHGDGVPVGMIWRNGGHSGPHAAGEVDNAVHPNDVVNSRILAWWDRWLRGDAGVDWHTGFSWYRPWAERPADDARPAYGTAAAYPVYHDAAFVLSGDGTIVPAGAPVAPGSFTLVNPPLGLPAAYSETSAIQSQLGLAPFEIPGQNAAWDTPPLTEAVELVGIPRVVLPVSSLTGEAQLYVKLYDVAPDGTATLIRRMVSPVRATDLSAPLEIAMTGLAHRFEAGHRVRLVVATTDLAYLNRRVPDVYTIGVDPAAPPQLVLPLSSAPAAEVGGRSTGPAATALGGPAVGSGSSGTAVRGTTFTLAATGGRTVGLGLAAGLLTIGLVARRRLAL